jgi:high-affinity iron transporter
MRRRFTVFAATLLGLLAIAGGAAGTASAQDESELERGRAEIERAGELVTESLGVYKEGDAAGAYDLARAAYLDHFEFVEVPLRLRDPNLVLDAEFAFAEYRNDIQAGAPLDEVRKDVREVRDYLLDIDRALAEKGVAAPALAFGFSFAILFREGVEAVLIIAILLGSLAAGAASNYKRPLGYGVLAAVAATGVTWLLASFVLEVAPLNREMLEAVTALIAVLILVMVSFWLISRLDQRRRMEFMRARLASAMAVGSAAAFVGLGFTAVYREGFETVLFYQALSIYAEGLELWLVLGAATAAVALAGVAYAILRLGKKLPVKPMLLAGAGVLLLLSVAFVGNAVRSLQSADVVAITPVDAGWARLPVFVAELTGIHPTTQGLLAQGVLLGLFLLGGLYTVVFAPRRSAQRPVPAHD